MRTVLIVLVALAAVSLPAATGATAPRAMVSYAPDVPGSGAGLDGVSTLGATAIGATAIGATAYVSSVEATRLVGSTMDGRGVALRRPDHLVGPAARYGAPTGGDAGGRRRYLPVLYSALVPGAGEVAMGYYKRGLAVMAVEVGAWAGYFYKHNQGLDTRDEYEAFADAHWDQTRWIDNHFLIYPTTGQTLEELEQIGRDASGSGVWPGYSPWVSRESDKQHYYENIGKYDWYVSGWEDYTPGTTPGDLGPGDVLSVLREEYRDMRHQSNQQLDAANRFIYVSIAARVFSLVQTSLLVSRARDEDRAGLDLDNYWTLSARSRGRDASEVTLEYWFK